MDNAIVAFWARHNVAVRLVTHTVVDLNAVPPLRFPAAHRNGQGEVEIVAALLDLALWKRSWTHIMADALHHLYGAAIPPAVRDALLAAQRHCPMRPRLLDEGVYRKIVQEEHAQDGWVQCWEPFHASFPVDTHALQAPPPTPPPIDYAAGKHPVSCTLIVLKTPPPPSRRSRSRHLCQMRNGSGGPRPRRRWPRRI
jgi:hypothetical protein